jgi:hypothetical protein
MNVMNLFWTIPVLLVTAGEIKSQEQDKQQFIDPGADIMSRYVWRGTDYGASPSIQPHLDFSAGNFAAGAWGAYATNHPGVQEMDLYLSYNIKEMITLTLTDYFFPDEVSGYDYYEFRKDSSDHIFEGMISFDGTDRMPVRFMAAMNFFNDNENSLYFEAGYSFSFLEFFAGAGNGLYTTDRKFGLVNVGISAGKEITITEKYALPVSVSLITNPQAAKVYLIFGISF